MGRMPRLSIHLPTFGDGVGTRGLLNFAGCNAYNTQETIGRRLNRL